MNTDIDDRKQAEEKLRQDEMEEMENLFWDCVRPDESPAGDRTKAAGILVSGVEAVRARCVKVSCGWVPRSALVVIDGPTRGLLDS
jgi:hypothetical protein